MIILSLKIEQKIFIIGMYSLLDYGNWEEIIEENGVTKLILFPPVSYIEIILKSCTNFTIP